MMLNTLPGTREGIPMKSKGLLPASVLCCLLIVLAFGITTVEAKLPQSLPYNAPAQATVTPVPGAADIYMDDRSTPAGLITSFVNAINRKEYLRAYSYWDTTNGNPPQLAPFPDFAKGYENTSTVKLIVGPIMGDFGAGQMYFSVPITYVTLLNNGVTQTFVGCYVMHESQPGIQGAPPFQPLAITDADVKTVPNNADTTSLMAQACNGKGGGEIMTPPAPPADPNAIDATRYIDDRSNAVQVLRSLFNAINRKEYVRAYSHWELPGSNPGQPPPFADFQQGYANTETVQLNTGTVTNDAGAGQLYYSVPVPLISTTTNGEPQNFVGCYQLHLYQPPMQATPPIYPLPV